MLYDLIVWSGPLITPPMGSKSSKNCEEESCQDPANLTFVTWNIDGLDKKDLEDRTIAVVEEIERVEADIVFLQEVVWNTFMMIQTRLSPKYECIAAKRDFYFVATLLKKENIRLKHYDVVDFKTSLMERHVLCVQVSCGKNDLELMNTHLESLAEHADERRRQLATCTQMISKIPDTRTVILAGDMNMEDTWLGEAEMGNIPESIEV